MNIVSIHQPHYHIWLGLLHKIASSDQHVILDDVQYRKRNFQSRARISTPAGEKLLSIPVINKGFQHNNLLIKDVQLADPAHLYKHFLMLKHNYGRCKGWPLIADELESLYLAHYEYLMDLNLALLGFTLKLFNVKTPLVYASSLNASGRKNDRILHLCELTDATHYVCGAGAQSYMEEASFKIANIEIVLQNFKHPKYKQFKDQWTAGCMALDWYFHQPEEAVNFLPSLSLN